MSTVRTHFQIKYGKKMEEMIKYLRKNAWVQAMDFVALYTTPPETRYQRNWSAILKSQDSVNYSSTATFVPLSPNYEKKYFSKDLDYSRIGCLGTQWHVFEFSERNKKYKQDFNEELNDVVITAYKQDNGNSIQSYEFEPNTLYEAVEAYADFDLKIADDTERHPDEYSRNYHRIFQVTNFPSSLPEDNDAQIKLCSDMALPVLTVQGPPGTGKTSFLSDLIEYLITQKGVSAGEIYCLTYTKRARAEIRRKLFEKVKAKQIPASAVPDLDIEATWTLDQCAGKIYCETFFRNPPNRRDIDGRARLQKRMILLIDEASQISIPYLLYGLRYGKDDSIVRLFGDQRQLDSVCTSVRDYEMLGNESSIRKHLGDGFER